MADTSIHPPHNVDLDPEIRAAFRAADGNKLARARFIAEMRRVWQRRRFVIRVVSCGAVAATLIALLVPARYRSTARLMPPDNRSMSGFALADVAGWARRGRRRHSPGRHGR